MVGKKNKKNYIDLILCIFSGFTAVICAYIVYAVWNIDISVPFVNSSDALSSLVTVKNIVNGNGIFHSDLVAPLGADYSGGMPDYFIQYIIIRIIGLFTKETGVVVNIYYLLGFFLISISSYYLLRKTGGSKKSSYIVSILLSQLPYHYFRGEGHLWLSSYYLVPLAALVLFWMYEGEHNSLDSGDDRSIKRIILASVFSALLSLGGIYYSFFFLCIGSIIILIKLFNERIRNVIIESLPLVSNAFFLIMSQLYNLIKILKNKKISVGASRAYTDVDAYALKWIYLILPVQGHRIKFLSRVRNHFDRCFMLNNENGLVSLGIVLSIGFVISCIACLSRKEKWNYRMCMCGALNIISIMLFTVGGIGELIGGTITTAFRSLNRGGLYVAFFAGIATVQLIDRLFDRMKFQWIQYTLSVILIIIGILDMTSSDISKYETFDPFEHKWNNSRNEEIEKVYNEKAFFSEVEAQMLPNSAIIELPIVCNTIYNIYPNGVIGSYDQLKPYVYTDGLKWSYGAPKGSENDIFLKKIQNLPIDDIINVLVYCDFTGALIYKKGYEKEQLQTIEDYFKSLDNAKLIYDGRGDYIFVDFSEYAAIIRGQHSEDDLKNKKQYYLYEYSGLFYEKFVADNLVYSSDIKSHDEHSLEILSGTIQKGPNIDLSKGDYKVCLEGRNLQEVDVCCTSESGRKMIPIEIVESNPEEIMYYIHLDSDYKDIEFQSKCDGDSYLISSILVEGMVTMTED